MGFAAVLEANGSFGPNGSEEEDGWDALLKKSESLKGSPFDEELAIPPPARPFRLENGSLLRNAPSYSKSTLEGSIPYRKGKKMQKTSNETITSDCEAAPPFTLLLSELGDGRKSDSQVTAAIGRSTLSPSWVGSPVPKASS